MSEMHVKLILTKEDGEEVVMEGIGIVFSLVKERQSIENPIGAAATVLDEVSGVYGAFRNCELAAMEDRVRRAIALTRNDINKEQPKSPFRDFLGR